MNSMTGFEMATIVKRQMREHFSYYQVTRIQILENDHEPKINLQLTHKLNQQTMQLLLVAEPQDTNPHNVHLSLFNVDPYFPTLYLNDRNRYVQRNHEVADQINDRHLIPENLYLIQDADGKPGVDFIHLELICDAINLIITISELFKN